MLPNKLVSTPDAPVLLYNQSGGDQHRTDERQTGHVQFQT
jgi:hypothetical protein